MRRSVLYFLLFPICANAANTARLPVVDVSRGDVSARALFGEEIAKPNKVAPVEKKVEKRVVARSAKKTNVASNVSNIDVLKPNRPSSNLWAHTGDEPLRMPRMDEIAVIRSDSVLPEEDLNSVSATIAQNKVVERASHDDVMNELNSLRDEIAKLKQSEQKIAARPMVVRTPISGENNVQPRNAQNNVNVRREIVPVDNKGVARASDTIAQPRVVATTSMNKMSPSELKKAFKKTYLSENKHLSTYRAADAFDTVSDMSSYTEGFTANRDLSEMDGGVRPLEIKISFLNGDAGLSRENYNLLSETASIVVNNPKRAVQIAIPESATHSKDGRKLAARRLAIVEQVLRDIGIADQRIVPVLSQRDEDVFVMRVISGDMFESLTQQKRNMFGDSVSKKTYKSMSW